MKKILAFGIVSLIIILLVGYNDDPRFLNDPIDFVDSEVITELDLSDIQLEFILNNNIVWNS